MENETRQLLAEVDAVSWSSFPDYYPDVAEVPLRFRRLFSSDEDERRDALDGVIQAVSLDFYGPIEAPGGELVRFLVRLIGSPDYPEQEHLLARLYSVLDDGLSAHRDDEDDLVLLQGHLRNARPRFAGLLRHPDPATRRQAFALLVRLATCQDPPAPLEPLPGMEEDLKYALGVIAEESDPEQRVRLLLEARFVLLPWQVPFLVDELMLGEHPPEVRLAAAITAAHLAGPAAPPAVPALLRDALFGTLPAGAILPSRSAGQDTLTAALGAVAALGPAAGMPIFLDLIRSDRLAGIMAVDVALRACEPWATGEPVRAGIFLVRPLVGVTAGQRALLEAVREQRIRLDALTGRPQGTAPARTDVIAERLSAYGLPADPDALQAALAALPTLQRVEAQEDDEEFAE